VDNETAYRLGYRPTGESERWSGRGARRPGQAAARPIGGRLQGGDFCSIEYAGTPVATRSDAESAGAATKSLRASRTTDRP